MSDFHPETWVPAWSVASILNGVLSFMLEATPTVGSIETSLAERRRLALASHAFNRKTPLFVELFPELVVQPAEGEADDEDASAEEGGGHGATWMGVSPTTFLAVVALLVAFAVASQHL
jgi:ubiquitin-conjugating enzyme E2 J2